MEKLQSSKQTNPVKAIRKYCLSCCLESAFEVEKCPASECELWEFRMGKNPYRTKRELTPEQLEVARERIKKANAARISAKHHLVDDAETQQALEQYKNTSERSGN